MGIRPDYGKFIFAVVVRFSMLLAIDSVSVNNFESDSASYNYEDMLGK